jgi:hypothetical protein
MTNFSANKSFKIIITVKKISLIKVLNLVLQIITDRKLKYTKMVVFVPDKNLSYIYT